MLPIIDFSEIKNDKCVRCSAKTTSNATYCKTCKLEIDSKTNEINLADIYDLPNSEAKSRLMDANIHKIFDIWQTTFNKKYTIINSSNKYEILKNVCRNASPSEITKHINGLFGVPCKIMAKYADSLFREIVDSKPDSVQYHYIHAIAPYILDVWNSSYNHGVFLCYYKDFGDLNRCPMDVDRIYSLWNAGKVF